MYETQVIDGIYTTMFVYIFVHYVVSSNHTHSIAVLCLYLRTASVG